MGDIVLVGIVVFFNINLCLDDYFYWFGGEEFVLICDWMVLEVGLILVEWLCKIIEVKKWIYF